MKNTSTVKVKVKRLSLRTEVERIDSRIDQLYDQVIESLSVFEKNCMCYKPKKSIWKRIQRFLFTKSKV